MIESAVHRRHLSNFKLIVIAIILSSMPDSNHYLLMSWRPRVNKSLSHDCVGIYDMVWLLCKEIPTYINMWWLFTKNVVQFPHISAHRNIIVASVCQHLYSISSQKMSLSAALVSCKNDLYFLYKHAKLALDSYMYIYSQWGSNQDSRLFHWSNTSSGISLLYLQWLYFSMLNTHWRVC